MLTRRQALAGGLSLPFAGGATSLAQTPIYLADMHFHSFFGNSVHHSRPVAEALAQGPATLVSWTLTGDVHWFDWKRTFKQTSEPKPGEAMGWFERELARIKAHSSEQKLKFALTPADVDRAMAGEPHIVLSVEGANFIESPTHVQRAYDLGVRHLQLVHYTRNALGDFQTDPPIHKGLTGLGREVIAECNRLGILIDVAHCAPATLHGVLGATKVPVVWSHGSVTPGPRPHPGLITWRARQLSLEDAKAVAAGGGVVGLWALSQDVGSDLEGYASRILQMVGWLGDQHVGFGTDMNGLGSNATIKSFRDLRAVVDILQKKRILDTRVRRIASENYARILKRAMQR